MEVSLLESEGLPEGCLLSIRSGSTRRQAVADPNKFKLVFPKGFKADDPVKVDALASLCSTNLVVEEGVERYDLQFTVPGGGACKVALLVREVVQAATEAQAAEVTGKLGTSEKGEGSASQRHRLAVSARRYLDDHQLLGWAHKLFQDLIRDQPENPWDYIDGKTESARKDAQNEPVKPPKVPSDEPPAPASDDKPPAPEVPMTSDPVDEEAACGLLKSAPPPAAPAEEPATDLEGLRKEARDVLRIAVDDGRLAAALGKLTPASPDKSLAEIRAEAGRVLLKMADEEAVVEEAVVEEAVVEEAVVEEAVVEEAVVEEAVVEEAVVEEAVVEEAVVEEVDEKPTEAPSDFKIYYANHIKTVQLEFLYARFGQAPQSLSATKSSASPATAKEEAAPAPAAEEAAPAPAAEEAVPTDDELRTRGLETLLRTAEDGSLENAIAEQQEDEVEALRKLAASSLLRAAEDGSLEKALAKPKEDEVEALRKLAASSLLRAAEDGSLEKALAKPKEDEVEAIRKQAAESLLRAAEDGSLEKALGKPKVDEVEVLRKKLTTMMSRAAEDGSLERALAKPQDDEVEAFRKQAAESLLRASEDGRLEQAVAAFEAEACSASPPAESPPPAPAPATRQVAEEPDEVANKELPPSDDIEALRAMARETFTRASTDGRLAELLAKPAVPEDKDHIDDLRKQVGDALAQASEDGSLLAALNQESGPDQAALASEPPQEPEPQLRSMTEEPDLEEVKLKAVNALHKVFGTAPEEEAEEEAEEEVAAPLGTLEPGSAAILDLTLLVKQELGSLQSEVTGQLEGLRTLSQEVRTDVEGLRKEVAEAKRDFSDFGASTSMPKSGLATTTGSLDFDLAGGSLADLEKKIRDRNDRFRKDNDSLRLENLRLKGLSKGPNAA